MRGLGSFVCFALALTLAGCTGGPAEARGPLRSDELSWIREVDRWYRGLREELGAVEAVYAGNLGPLLDSDNAAARSRYGETLRGYEACSASLGEEVEPAPTSRLEPARQAAVRACGRVEEAAQATLGALARGDYADLVRLEEEWRAAFVALNQIFLRIDGLLRDARTLPVVVGTAGRSHIDATLSRVASSLAGFDAEVRCWAPGDWNRIVSEAKAMSSVPVEYAGFTSTNLMRINVPVDVCSRLNDLASPEGAVHFPYDDIVEALNILAHEAMHVSRYWDEVEAECYGLQHVAEAARELGASADFAAELADIAWGRLYPAMPAEYRSADCRNNGPLDLDRANDRWP